MKRLIVPALVLALASPGLLRAQRPEGWRWRYDRANAVDSQLQFTTMAPGWHVTTGPAAILYNPSQAATGRWRLEMEVHLFPPGDHAEGYGLFFGGQHLDGADQSYTYFLLRKDGQFLIKRRNGTATSDVVPWTANAAVVAHPGDQSNVKNVLAVEVGADSVTFSVNGRRVHAVAKSALATDGQVGLRINHGLNVHVSKLQLTPAAGGR